MQSGFQIYKEDGQYEQLFLELQRIQKCDPGMPGLFEFLEEAAILSLPYHRGHFQGQVIYDPPSQIRLQHACCWRVSELRMMTELAALQVGATCGANAYEKHHERLGICRHASAREIRQAYFKVATKCHPDKWMHKPEEQRTEAEAIFRDAKEAYDWLTLVAQTREAGTPKR